MSAAALAVLAAAVLGEAPSSPAPDLRLSVYVRGGGALYLSNARTVGGVGGSVGLRGELNRNLFLQLDVGTLFLVGNVLMVRVGAGWQLDSPLYAPAATATFTMLHGEQFLFLDESRALPPAVPAMSLGLSVAPLRFNAGEVVVSLLELGAGLGTDFPGLGLNLQVVLMEISARFP